MAGTAVFRMVVSSDSMKKATATNQGSSRLLVADGVGEAEAVEGPVEFMNQYDMRGRQCCCCIELRLKKNRICANRAKRR